MEITFALKVFILQKNVLVFSLALSRRLISIFDPYYVYKNWTNYLPLFPFHKYMLTTFHMPDSVLVMGTRREIRHGFFRRLML